MVNCKRCPKCHRWNSKRVGELCAGCKRLKTIKIKNALITKLSKAVAQ